jgi:zinc D-Ala-D-Ala carboxypeptidase
MMTRAMLSIFYKSWYLLIILIGIFVFLPYNRLEPPVKYGRIEYPKANPQDMVFVSKRCDRFESSGMKLHRSAVKAFERMRCDALKDGVEINLLSAFRDIEEQKVLFKQNTMLKGGSKQAAARVVSPPGYSEHQTGYVVDLEDAVFARLKIKKPFEQSKTYAWVMRHAAQYGFEMSYPDDTLEKQYEPWHWRYIGDKHSCQLFHGGHC